MSDASGQSSLRYSLDSLDLGHWETGEDEDNSSPSVGRVSDQSSDGEDTFVSGKRLLDSMLEVEKQERSEATGVDGAACDISPGKSEDEVVDVIEPGDVDSVGGDQIDDDCLCKQVAVSLQHHATLFFAHCASSSLTHMHRTLYLYST